MELTELNKYVQREAHLMPVGEHVIGQLGKENFFSKLDANCDFWQFELAEDSVTHHLYHTIRTFKFKRLPFRISAGPEFFQKKMTLLLDVIKGVVMNMDDILIYGETLKRA